MGKIQPARGTRDIIGEELKRMRYVEQRFLSISEKYGFEEIRTPVFEFTEVFSRPLGDSSDIVAKEMYSFEDRGGESLTLRPEFTAGIVRAFISGGMQQNLPCRLSSIGPAFRYERPQKGRYRQFHQINAEWLGLSVPHVDVELIAMAWRLLGDLNLQEKIALHVNSLGDVESRQAYRQALVAYYEQHRANLSADSLVRLKANPLRILDSKDEGDRRINQLAPKLIDYLNETSSSYFKAVQAGLEALNIPFDVNHNLVRGMDYYCHTAFEFITTELGAQGTVIGGGRYDGLVKTLGGPDVAGIGFAGGIERLAMLLPYDIPGPRPVIILPMGEVLTQALTLGEALRAEGFTTLIDAAGNLAKRLKRADNKNAHFAIIIGEEEIAREHAQVKNLSSGEQVSVAQSALASFLRDNT